MISAGIAGQVTHELSVVASPRASTFAALKYSRRGNDRQLTCDLPGDTRRDHIVIGDISDMVVPCVGSASVWAQPP